MVAVGGVVDLAEPAAERDLRLGVEVQAAEDQHAVVLQRVEDRVAERVVGCQPIGVDAGDLGADGRA